MRWGRNRNNDPPNYFGGRMPDLRTYPGTLKEYDIEKKRAIALQSCDSDGGNEMHIGDRYTYTQINIYVKNKSKNDIPDAEELYQEILRKRKGNRWE